MAKNDFERQFAVAVGSGNFPHDMLRYDACFPALESECHKFETPSDPEAYRTPRVIILARYKGQPGSWTEGRWKSFLWSIRTFSDLYEARAHAEQMRAAFAPRAKED